MVAMESTTALSVGDEAPDFELPGTDGETYSLSSFDGFEALLVVFTCNHCPYAKAKIDELNQLAEEYDGLAVVGVNPNDADQYPDDSTERMREVVEAGEVRYTAYLRDEDQSVADAYRAVCTPDPFLLENDDGTVRLAYHGRLDDALNPDDEPSRFYMREAVEAVLAGEDVPFADEELPSRGCSIKWYPGEEPDWWSEV
jgi:peroxiredoxin